MNDIPSNTKQEVSIQYHRLRKHHLRFVTLDAIQNSADWVCTVVWLTELLLCRWTTWICSNFFTIAAFSSIDWISLLSRLLITLPTHILTLLKTHCALTLLVIVVNWPVSFRITLLQKSDSALLFKGKKERYPLFLLFQVRTDFLLWFVSIKYSYRTPIKWYWTIGSTGTLYQQRLHPPLIRFVVLSAQSTLSVLNCAHLGNFPCVTLSW